MKLHAPSVLLGTILVSILAFASPQMTIQPIPHGLTQAQRDVLDLLSVVYIDDCQSGPGYKTLRVEGANLQVVNGLGITDTTNGLGNVIVGYNENTSLCDRSGSHNAILGTDNSYSAYAGLVGGFRNLAAAPYSLVFGRYNTSNYASGSILCGAFNVVGYDNSAIVGGEGNMTLSEGTVIVGGQFNSATGRDAVLGGGLNRHVAGDHDWMAGSLLEDN